MFNVFIVANITHGAVFSLAEPHRGSFCGGLPVLLGNATPVSGGEGGEGLTGPRADSPGCGPDCFYQQLQFQLKHLRRSRTGDESDSDR